MTRPAAPAFTEQMAASWRSGIDARWGKVAIAATWVAALILSVSWGGADCTPMDPSVCGPDLLWAWAAVPLLATPLLIWWMPLVACIAGVAFAVFDQVGDPVQSLHVVWGLHGVLCVAFAVFVVRHRDRQRHISMVGSGAAHVRVPGLEPGRPSPWVAFAVVVSVVAGPGGLIRYQQDVASHAVHVAAAEESTGVVRSIDNDDYTLSVVLDDDSRVTVDALEGHYHRGDEVPVLVDRTGSELWAELVAEPGDPTGWLSLGIGGLALALLLTVREARRRRSISVLSTRGGTAVEMDATWTSSGVELAAVGGRRPVARLRLRSGRFDDVDHDDDDLDDEVDETWNLHEAIVEFGAAWRGAGIAAAESEPPAIFSRVTVIGELSEGSHVVIVTDEGAEVPTGPVRAVRQPLLPRLGRILRWRGGPTEPTLGPDGLPGVPVGSAVDADLPADAGAPLADRMAGLALIATAALPPIAMVYGFFDNWWQAIWISWGGGMLCLAGLRKLSSVRLEHSRLIIDGPVRTLVVPWARVHGVRRDDGVLFIACDPDVVVPVGPFSGAGSHAEAAERLGGAMMRLRERALAAGDSGVEPTWAYSPRLCLLVLYGVACLGTFLWHFLPH